MRYDESDHSIVHALLKAFGEMSPDDLEKTFDIPPFIAGYLTQIGFNGRSVGSHGFDDSH